MQAFVNINSQKFLLNGIPYYKNFMPFVINNKLKVVNVYDSKLQLFDFEDFGNVSVNGNTFGSIALLVSALLPTIFTRDTLGSGSSTQLNEIITAPPIVRIGTTNTFSFPIGYTWRYDNALYANTAIINRTIAPATEGFKRIDIAVVDTFNNIVIVQGVASEDVAVEPSPLPNTLRLTAFSVNGDVVSEPTTPVVGVYVEKAEFFQKLISGTGSVSVVLDTQETNFRIISDDITMIEGTSPTSGYLSQYLREDKLLSFINKTANPIVFKHSLEANNFRLPNGANLTVQPNELIRFRLAKDDVSPCYEFDSLSRVGSTNEFRTYRTDDAGLETVLEVSDLEKYIDNVFGSDIILTAGLFPVNGELVIKNSIGAPIEMFGIANPETGDLPTINGNVIDEFTPFMIEPYAIATLKKVSQEDFMNENWILTYEFENVPSSGPTSTDFLVEGSTNLYFTDARALAAVPNATPSTAGKSKLYANLTSTNTDGAVRQKEVVERFNSIGLQLSNYDTLLSFNNLRQTTDRSYVYLFDHFTGIGLDNGYTQNSGNGGNASVGENRTGAKGVSVVHTGTSSATGQGALIIGNVNFPPIIIGQGQFYFRTRIQIPVLSDGSQTFYAQEGFLCNNFRFNPSGSMMFMYDQSGAFAAGANAGSPNWKCVTNNGTSRTFSITSIPVIAGTWYELLIIVNAAGTQVDFYIDGNLQFSHTTNIPTIPCFIHHSIVKTVGNSQRETVRDWVQYQHN